MVNVVVVAVGAVIVEEAEELVDVTDGAVGIEVVANVLEEIGELEDAWLEKRMWHETLIRPFLSLNYMLSDGKTYTTRPSSRNDFESGPRKENKPHEQTRLIQQKKMAKTKPLLHPVSRIRKSQGNSPRIRHLDKLDLARIEPTTEG